MIFQKFSGINFRSLASLELKNEANFTSVSSPFKIAHLGSEWVRVLTTDITQILFYDLSRKKISVLERGILKEIAVKRFKITVRLEIQTYFNVSSMKIDHQNILLLVLNN